MNARRPASPLARLPVQLEITLVNTANNTDYINWTARTACGHLLLLCIRQKRPAGVFSLLCRLGREGIL